MMSLIKSMLEIDQIVKPGFSVIFWKYSRKEGRTKYSENEHEILV